MFPRARKDRLTIHELPDETLVYDHDCRKAHCLNATAALVWRHCDGNTSLDELARLVVGQIAVPRATEVVALALEQLARRHLLEEALVPSAPAERISRRDSLKKLALAAATLPLILTVTTRAAAQTMSGVNTSSDPPSADPPPATTTPVQVNLNVTVSGGDGGGGGGSKPTPPPAPPAKPAPCRTKGQSCVASASEQQGTCCAGLSCTGVSTSGGVCG